MSWKGEPGTRGYSGVYSREAAIRVRLLCDANPDAGPEELNEAIHQALLELKELHERSKVEGLQPIVWEPPKL